MSLIRNGLLLTRRILQSSLSNAVVTPRYVCLSSKRFCAERPAAVDDDPEEESVVRTVDRAVDPSKDRTKVIPVETSIRYLESKAYKETYGDDPVWVFYKRNHKGQLPPRKTRKTCIRGGMISTGNPCPICRDEYLVLDYRNVKLLKQFISPYNGEVLSYTKTGVCQRKHHELLSTIIRAKDYGTLTYDPPFRRYEYRDWFYIPPKPKGFWKKFIPLRIRKDTSEEI